MNMQQAMAMANDPAMQAKMARLRTMEKAKAKENYLNLDDASSCCGAPISDTGYCETCGEPT